MSVPSSFLTLSIKTQIFITILILTLFSVLVILCLPGSFSYEILMEDYKRKKSFFYNEYKEYIEACFYFQSLNIFKYEELIKRMSKQIFKYSTRESIFESYSDFQGDYNDSYPVQDLFENDDNNENILYQYCYNKDKKICNEYKGILRNKYESINGLIFSHDMIHRLNDPFLNEPLIDSFFSINVNDSVIYGFNKNGLYKGIVNTENYSNINTDQLKAYYDNIITKQLNFVLDYLLNFLDSNLFLFNELFGQAVSEIYQLEEVAYFYDPNITQFDAANAYMKAALGFYPMLELENDKCYLATHKKEENKFYYFQFNLIEDYLGLVNNLISNQINMDFIPLYSFNHTILSPALCSMFLLRQSHEMTKEKNLNESYNSIERGISGIEACFFDKKIFENEKIKEMFGTNIVHFLSTSNIIYQGLIELNEPYYFMKYSFPNLNTLKIYKSSHLYTDQIDFYLFSSFKEPFEFSEYIKNQYRNLFYLMVILILYIWIICFVVNVIVYNKLMKQIIEPINKLQEAIETNNIKDENIFKFEYDDIINELFITCKELLTGQINTNNKLKYSCQFNIINKQNDKDKIIDKNKYEKNIIINNEIMNDLINEQQNMNDYSKEIGFNEDYNINHDIIDLEENKKENNDHKKSTRKKDIIYNSDSRENQEIKENLNKSNEKEDSNRKAYKDLFKLGEYLYHYRTKVEQNNIIINYNSNIEDKKSNKSKIDKNGQNQIRNQKHKKSILSQISINDNDKSEDNISINVLNDKDITYLWYMEMKKKNNKSFNYELSDDLEELFDE